MNEPLTTRRLWLIRHAKAADGEPGQRDFDRPLTSKGEHQCTDLAEWLSDRMRDRTVLALVSPAARAQQTADRVLGDWFDGERREAERIWEASARRLTGLLEETDGDLALIGHNPGLEQLQALLTGQVVPLPTAGAFEIAFDEHRRCRLEARFQPDSDST
jgi:phosphohistidine phosphatase